MEFPLLESISLANNNIYSLLCLDTLPSRVPNLVNLSLENNALSGLKDIEAMPGRQFKCLKELVLLGNKVREFTVAKHGEFGYRS